MESAIAAFGDYLRSEEKSPATLEKYLRDVRNFKEYLMGRELTKQEVMAYKNALTEAYAPASVNSMLVAVNAFLKFQGRSDCCVKLLKIQRQIFCREDRELTAAEYRRLLRVAGERTRLILQTICETGIRVSELRHITVEAVTASRAEVRCKGKNRVILISAALRRALSAYMKKSGLTAGSIFVTRTGRPLDRTNVWRDMKALCAKAGVEPGKVFPHNLRHLFARTFYAMERDIVRLADVLGHSSINTTRIYTIESGLRHIDCLDRIHQRLMT